MKKIIWIGSTILAAEALMFNSVMQLVSMIVGVAFGAPDSAEWPLWVYAGFVIVLYFGFASVFSRIFARAIAKQALLERDQ